MLLLALALGCGDDDAGPADSGTVDAGLIDAGLVDSGADDADDAGAIDAGADDSGADDAGVIDAGPPIPCAFNRECPDTMFCDSNACEEGCYCALGERGTGALGDACASGNDCASSICLEGPGDALLCSIECEDDLDCGGMLPNCTDVAFVGRICVRTPPT